MWLFLINPLKLCSYGSWSLQGYACKSSCCQCHILCLDIEKFKIWSVHFIDWWLCRSHSATQPVCQSGWSSHSALCHSARVAGGGVTQPLSHSARVAGAATQPLCQSGWRSQSATQPFCHSRCQSGWSSHSATLPEWLSGWCENFRHCAFNQIIYVYIYIYISWLRHWLFGVTWC